MVEAAFTFGAQAPHSGSTLALKGWLMYVCKYGIRCKCSLPVQERCAPCTYGAQKDCSIVELLTMPICAHILWSQSIYKLLKFTLN